VELNDEVCLCFHVTKRKVLNFIRIHKPRVPSQLAECFGAGTGCGWCRRLLIRYFQEAAERGEVDPAPEPTPEEWQRMRAQYVREGGGVPPPGATPLPNDEADEPSTPDQSE
jgi:bacterioferritin-associated ferredoxin